MRNEEMNRRNKSKMAAAINSIPEFVPSSMNQNQNQNVPYSDPNVTTEYNQNDSEYWYAESKDCQCCIGYKYSCQCCSMEYGGNYECTYCNPANNYYNTTEDFANNPNYANNNYTGFDGSNMYASGTAYPQTNNKPNGSPRNYSQYNESANFGLNTKAQEFVPSFAMNTTNYNNTVTTTSVTPANTNASTSKWNYKPPATVTSVFNASNTKAAYVIIYIFKYFIILYSFFLIVQYQVPLPIHLGIQM